MSAPTDLSRDQVFDELIALGFVRAIVEFHGGGDEGYVDTITFFRSDDEDDWVQSADYSTLGPERLFEASNELRLALEDPIWDHYGGFAGDYDVSGELVWSVAERSCKMSGSITDWVDESWEA